MLDTDCDLRLGRRLQPRPHFSSATISSTFKTLSLTRRRPGSGPEYVRSCETNRPHPRATIGASLCPGWQHGVLHHLVANLVTEGQPGGRRRNGAAASLGQGRVRCLGWMDRPIQTEDERWASRRPREREAPDDLPLPRFAARDQRRNVPPPIDEPAPTSPDERARDRRRVQSLFSAVGGCQSLVLGLGTLLTAAVLARQTVVCRARLKEFLSRRR
jgi:hypothetical protein